MASEAQGNADLPTIADELAGPMVVTVLPERGAHLRILHADDALVSFSIGPTPTSAASEGSRRSLHELGERVLVRKMQLSLANSWATT